LKKGFLRVVSILKEEKYKIRNAAASTTRYKVEKAEFE